jgi:DNA-binding SARP family transcriptional activator/TolB-like protein
MPRLSLSLLGRPRIERDGVAVEINRRKTIALLTYLAVTAEPHHRDKLAALLWPRHPRDRARAALRRTLTEIRHAIGEEWISTDGDMVGLRKGDGLWLDVQHFNALSTRLEESGRAGKAEVDLSLLKEVADLYRADFLSEFLLDTNTTFSEWQFFQAEALRKRVIATLDRLVEGHVAGGEHGLAIAYARRRLDLDPVAERAHRQLMRLYAITAQPSLAVRQYRECTRRLQREIGVEPDKATHRLYQDVLARRPVSAQEPVGASPPEVAAPPAQAPRPARLPPTRRKRILSFLRSRLGVLALAGMALVAIGLGVAIAAATRAARPPTIALLALSRGAPAGEAEEFAAGMEEALLTSLAKLRRLVVRPTTHSGGSPFQETAAALGVDYLLDGSVFSAGNSVRVSLRLVDARHDRILWADGFDRMLDDPLGVQASVAHDAALEVAKALRLE